MKTGIAFSPSQLRLVRGFTLLEMCLVLVIIAVLMGVMMPSIQSAFAENAVRADARQLSLLIKTGMLESSDEHRDYVLKLSSNAVDLHPARSPDEDQARVLDSSNKLLVPDPRKANGWKEISTLSWFFQPGELCPATRVRLARGPAWLEMSFNALTGNVENETAYFP
jgi:prepilin-type N-terminal cleavage/methylation domain-containing protein